jgi:hypothetical protein
MGMNKGAHDSSPVACSEAIVGGSGSFCAYRGCCGGGDGNSEDHKYWWENGSTYNTSE